jgi:D-xylose 1-dehydrogenase
MSASTSQSGAARYPCLRERAVFITGGGSGIGAAIVTAFAAQGARVAFIDVAQAASRALVDGLAAAGHPRPWWRVCDVRDVPALQASIAAAAAELGDFHALVNNVASDDRHTLASITPAYYDERMAINQRAALFALQAVVPGMQRLGGGSIINLGSFGWQIKTADYPCYAMAKSSINGLTPGWVMTERQKALWVTAEGEAEIDRNQCLPDRLQPQDVAAMVVFLASDEARMCTAQEFIVDAGWR